LRQMLRMQDISNFFETDVAVESARKLRRAASTGRPLGGAEWLKALEKSAARDLAEPSRGRPSAGAKLVTHTNPTSAAMPS